MPPLGYWDPLGFSKVGDEDGFKRRRDVELKHGRVAMLAAVGLVVQHFIHMDVPKFDTYVPVAPYGMGAICLFYGSLGFALNAGPLFVLSFILELVWAPANQRREPGDFGDPLRIGMYTENMRNAELLNGRFAMISVMGIFAAELATGKDAAEQLGF